MIPDPLRHHMASNQMSSQKHDSEFWAASNLRGQSSSKAVGALTTPVTSWNGHLQVREPNPEDAWHLRMQVGLKSLWKTKLNSLPVAMTSAIHTHTHTPSKPRQMECRLTVFYRNKLKALCWFSSPLSLHKEIPVGWCFTLSGPRKTPYVTGNCFL